MEEMLRLIQKYGVKNPMVVDAIKAVDRRHFVPESEAEHAYDDRPLSIGYGQTISQPYTVARMVELLIGIKNNRVLEVGTGSGWLTAILSKMFRQVYSVEFIPQLSNTARKNTDAYGCKNIIFRVGDGKKGLPEFSPFDGIIVSANADTVPPDLIDQLVKGGRMVIPVKNKMTKIVKETPLRYEEYGEFSFVPLV